METIEVLGKTYEVIEVIPKKHSEYDLFLCKSKAGYKECFQRIDIGREPKKIKMSDAVPWSLKEIEIVKEAVKKGILIKEIATYEELNRHTPHAVMTRATMVKRDMLYKKEIEQEKTSRPRFNIKF